MVKHNLWSSLDELGLLVGLDRMPAESGASYIGRLEQRMLWPPNSSTQGLTNALSIEFGLRPYNIENKNVFFLTHRPENVDDVYLGTATVTHVRHWDRTVLPGHGTGRFGPEGLTISWDESFTIPYTLEVTVNGLTTVDGSALVQYVEVNPETPPDGWKIPQNAEEFTPVSSKPGFIIWRDRAGQYTQVLEFKNYTPPTGSEIRVEYVYRNDEGLISYWADFSDPNSVTDTRFLGQKADTPNLTYQLRILTVDDLPETPE
jgi:hypothetical protein